MLLEFSEGKCGWKPVPNWVSFLLHFGYNWPTKIPVQRRIAILSMPCDSAAAGLITLGAMVRDLGNPQANEKDGHARRLAEHATQYLQHCRTCTLEPCAPTVRGCGLIHRSDGILKSIQPDYAHLRYAITKLGPDSDCPFWLRPNFRGGNMCPTVEELKEFFINGESPPEIHLSAAGLSGARYNSLLQNPTIVPENLRRSFGGLCMAGRAGGENLTKQTCGNLRFRNDCGEFSLGETLTISGWSAEVVSRVSFFNPRTGRLDRNTVLPSLVVADGDTSFLKAASKAEFQQSDIIGIIDQTLERDRLEAVGLKLAHFAQWYTPDEDLLARLNPPRGLSLAILKRA